MPNTPPRVLLARILAPHGVRGGVHLACYAQDAKDLRQWPLFFEDGRAVKITSLRGEGQRITATLEGVDTRTAAEALNGQGLWTAREALPQPLEGEYYHADLIGCRALDASGVEVGQVTGVHNYGAGDLLAVTFASGNEEYIPFKEGFVGEVDAVGRTVALLWLPS
ncbi:MAG: ribosome maturation factor RimM [Holosporales bacterium]